MGDGEEGLWCCISHGIFYLGVMADQIVHVSYEYNECWLWELIELISCRLRVLKGCAT